MTCVSSAVTGRLTFLMMRRPVNVTFASIAFHRSVWKASTGTALAAGWCAASPRRLLLAFESAPMIGARSVN